MRTIKKPYFNYLFTLLVAGIDPGTRHVKYFLIFLYSTRERAHCTASQSLVGVMVMKNCRRQTSIREYLVLPVGGVAA